MKGVEKLENLRRKFREDPEEKHRVMMEKVHAVAPDLATYLEKCTNLSQCRLSTYLGVLLVEIRGAAREVRVDCAVRAARHLLGELLRRGGLGGRVSGWAG